MAEVMSLQDPHQGGTAAILNALLLARDTTFRQIAADLSLTEEVVRIYGELFFNVKDRLKEAPYIQNIVYPGTRLASGRIDPAQALLVVGYERGRGEVLRLAGLRVQDGSAASSAELARQLEQTMLQQGTDHLRCGEHDHPSVKPALKLVENIRKAKAGAALDAPPDDSVKGLTAISLEYGVNDYIRAMTEDSIRHRQALAQQEYDEKQQRQPLINGKPLQAEASAVVPSVPAG